MSDDLLADLRRVSGVILNRLDDATNVLARQMILKNAKAVQLAADRIEALEREAILDAKLLADTQALLDKAEVVMREAADRIEQLKAERDYTEGTNEVLRGENQRLEAALAAYRGEKK